MFFVVNVLDLDSSAIEGQKMVLFTDIFETAEPPQRWGGEQPAHIRDVAGANRHTAQTGSYVGPNAPSAH
jgi:hypothetical protein